MSLSFELEIEKLEELEAYLSTIRDRVELEDPQVKESLKEVFQAVMFEDLKKRFASSPSTTIGGTVYGGQEWRSLSEYYLAQRPERIGGQIYKDTFALQNSLIGLDPNNISEFGSDRIYTFGTRLKYADKLQKMRAIIFMHPVLSDELVEAYEEFLVSELDNNRRR